MQAFAWRGGAKRLVRRLFSACQSAPVTIPAALAAFSLVAIFHLLIGQYSMALVVPIGGLVALMSAIYAHRLYLSSSLSSTAGHRTFDILVIAGIIIWCCANLLFTSEHLFTNRDPATYNLAGNWLTKHASLQIEKPAALEQLSVPGLHAESLGFATNPNNGSQIHAQGAHILPAWQALAGKLFGPEGVLRFNALFGATALLALYGFARLLVRPQWAALATLIMSLSLPLLFAVRDSYTEPLTMTFVFGGLTLLAYAQQNRQKWQWWLAGLVLGCTSLARIDAYIILAGIEVALLIWLLLAARAERRTLATCIGWLVLGTALGAYLAWLDVTLLSTAYYEAHRHLIVPELLLITALPLLAAPLIWAQWRWQWIRHLDRLTRSWRAPAVWIGVSGFFAILASRPAWFIGYDTRDGEVVRSFSEQTINWVWWYLGPVTLIAGVAGLAWCLIVIMRGKNRLWLPFVAAFVTMGLLYLLKPSITGDQVWATRRLLPVVIPGFVLFAVWLFQLLYERTTWRAYGRRLNLQIITAVLGTTAVLSPLFITYPFAIRRLYVPELAQVQTICNATAPDTIIIWVGESADFAVQPTRTLCGNDSLGLGIDGTQPANRQKLSDIYEQSEASGLRVVVGFYEDASEVLPLVGEPRAMLISSASYHEIEHSYKRPPRNMITLQRDIYLGQLTSEGIAPIAPKAN